MQSDVLINLENALKIANDFIGIIENPIIPFNPNGEDKTKAIAYKAVQEDLTNLIKKLKKLLTNE